MKTFENLIPELRKKHYIAAERRRPPISIGE